MVKKPHGVRLVRVTEQLERFFIRNIAGCNWHVRFNDFTHALFKALKIDNDVFVARFQCVVVPIAKTVSHEETEIRIQLAGGGRQNQTEGSAAYV